MSGEIRILVSEEGQHSGQAAAKKTVLPPDVGHVIRGWRHRLGLTQEGLAQALGPTFSTVSRWENGHKRPSTLAWKGLMQIAAERGSPLVEGGTQSRQRGSDSL